MSMMDPSLADAAIELVNAISSFDPTSIFPIMVNKSRSKPKKEKQPKEPKTPKDKKPKETKEFKEQKPPKDPKLS